MKTSRMLAVMIGLLLCAAAPMFSQTPASERGNPDPPKGNLQRSTEILYFKRLADGGPDRGKEIYFYKCWVCHNSYTRAAGSPAPPLKDLYKRPMLFSGKPMTDESVTDQIKNGSARMPGYKYALSEQDISDLVAFLRSGKCCWEDHEEHNPPMNSRFKVQGSKLSPEKPD